MTIVRKQFRLIFCIEYFQRNTRMNASQTESNILLCGSARVGKSSLINAICQQSLAETSPSLNSCTKHATCYTMEYTDGEYSHRTNFWDTAGIESWDEAEVRCNTAALIEQTKPVCLIYCASPGSFARLEQLEWLVSECARQKVFCALVCTNMWAGQNRRKVLEEFRTILANVFPYSKPEDEDRVTYFGRHALCTMVNSETYVDDDFGARKEPSGVNELIFGIGKCLERDCMLAWLRVVAQNKPFWAAMSTKLSAILRFPIDSVKFLWEYPAGLINWCFQSADQALRIATNAETAQTVQQVVALPIQRRE